ncbi:hypothetical protein ACFVH4_22955 [Nocardia ignorata]|uniref:hypothetical protein n=1 Tax=Nocardia ignorata TaxID=145285 RepID=UPI0036303AA8
MTPRRFSLPWTAAAVSACSLVVVTVIAAAMWLGREDRAANTRWTPGTPVDTPTSRKYRELEQGNHCELMDLAELTRRGSAGWQQDDQEPIGSTGYCSGAFGDLTVSLSLHVTRAGGDRRGGHDRFKYLVGQRVSDPNTSFEYLAGLGEDAFVEEEADRAGRPVTKVRIGVLDENLHVDTTLTIDGNRISRAELRQLTEHHVRVVMRNLRA